MNKKWKNEAPGVGRKSKSPLYVQVNNLAPALTQSRMYRKTYARMITGNKDRDKKARPQAEVFYFEVFISCNHEGEVCILFK